MPFKVFCGHSKPFSKYKAQDFFFKDMEIKYFCKRNGIDTRVTREDVEEASHKKLITTPKRGYPQNQ